MNDPEDGDPDRDDSQSDVVLQTEAEVACPYCGETAVIGLDPGGGASQDYVEDCPVCCRPWRVRVRYNDEGTAEIWVEES